MKMARVSAALTGLMLVVAACGADEQGGSSAPDTAVDAPPATDAASPAEATATDPADPPADPATAGEPTEAGADPDVGATDPVVVPAALQFTAPLVGGGELDAAALAGKPTIFWFWAPT